MARPSSSTSTRTQQIPRQRRGHGVVVGTDGSPWGSAALGWAARHAWLMGTELAVYQAAEDPPAEPSTSDRLLTMQPLPVRVHTGGSDPLRTMVPASEDSELVVLGCRGQQHTTIGLGRWVVPVVAAAHCDTVVVRGLPPAVHGQHRSITAMVCGSSADHAVLDRGAELAAAYRSSLRVVHAWAPPSGRYFGVAPVRPTDVLERAREHLSDRRIQVSFVPVEGQPYEVVATFRSTDLLVVGAGDTSRLGTVTRQALHHALCPVLVVQRLQ